jgi:mono/diheme cytochrome c family protein
MTMLKDGEIYWVVTNGIGKKMPGFKAELSDVERWRVVNYVRTLAR